MYTTSYFQRNSRVLISNKFDLPSIQGKLDKFENILNGKMLTTSYDGREICTVEVSDRYYNFDFATFCKNILVEIQKYFEPETYGIIVQSGVQELRLIGGRIMIGDIEYKKMISIVNSTDKSKALTMSIGLVHMKSPKYHWQTPRPIYNILTSFSNKHFKSSLPDKIKAFADHLVNFNIDIEFHVTTIEDLASKQVMLKDFVKSILFKDDGKVLKSVELKLRAFGKKMIQDYGQKENYKLLDHLEATKFDKHPDFQIDAKTIYDAYTEIFNNQDSSVIGRENRRVIEALKMCENIV